MNWFAAQWEWFKSFFSDTYESGIAGKASSKRVIELVVIWAFIVGFMKVVVYMTFSPVAGAVMMVPDIPQIWAIVILGILGFKTYENLKSDALKAGNGVKPPEPLEPVTAKLPGVK
jgi:hypothetical protein